MVQRTKKPYQRGGHQLHFIADNGYIYYSAVGNSLSSSNAGFMAKHRTRPKWDSACWLCRLGNAFGVMDSDNYGYLFAGVYTTISSNS
jgi:hypothetical protein